MDGIDDLNPIQRDIYLDESIGTNQNYRIGIELSLSKSISEKSLTSAARLLESELLSVAQGVMSVLRETSPCLWSVGHIDLSGESSSEGVEKKARELVKENNSYHGGLVQIRLLTLAGGCQRLVVSTHHLIFDGVSVVEYARRLLCLAQSDSPEFVATTMSTNWSSSDDHEFKNLFDTSETIEFWRTYHEQLSRSVDWTHEAVDLQDAIELHEVPFGEFEELKQYCKKNKLSLGFLLKCVFAFAAAQLHSLGESIVVDEVLDLRPKDKSACLGSFSGFAPFIVDFPDDRERFSSYVFRCRSFQRERKRFLHLSRFAAKSHGISIDGARFIYNYHAYASSIPDLQGAALLQGFTSESPNAVQFYAYHPSADELNFKCSHPGGDLYAYALIGAVKAVLTNIFKEDASLCELDIVDADGLTQLESWNSTVHVYDDASNLIEQVQRTESSFSGEIALSFGNQVLTYGQLRERSNRLARLLRSHGVSRNRFVGIFLPRSFDMEVSVLAALKAGGAYVPLDIEFPRERIRAMLEGVRASVILTHQTYVNLLESTLPDESTAIIALDSPETLSQLAQLSTGNLPREEVSISSGDAAYVIHTSGSTGRPKGVVVEHGGLVNRLNWMTEEMGFSSDDVFLQKTPYSFDVSVWELFLPLTIGARLVISKPDGHKDPMYLRDLIDRERITVSHFVPSMLAAFLECDGVERLAELRHIVCSGEALPLTTFRAASATFPEGVVWNLYGPTEASIDVTFWRPDVEAEATSVPIGKPIYNVTCYVCNEKLKRLPIGTVGELYLGGVGLARGYIANSALTDERFISSPFPGARSARLYKTGDLVRFLPDGNIEYLGRKDEQLKLRGYRVEPGEIEAVIRRAIGGGMAAVLGVPGTEGISRLVAFIRKDGSQHIDISLLQRTLADVLPAYMVPSDFLELESFPTTPNGKLDKKKMLSLVSTAREVGTPEPGLLPQDAIEEAVLTVFARVLDHPTLSMSDDFFVSGGQSISAAKLAARIQRKFSVPISLGDVFRNASPRAMAAHINQMRSEHESLSYPVIGRSNDPAVVSFAQEQLWLLQQLQPETSAYNIFSAMRVTGALDVHALRGSFDDLMERHEVLRNNYGGLERVVPVSRKDLGDYFAEVDIEGNGGEIASDRLDALLQAECSRPFNLAEDTLLRVTLIRLRENQHVVAVNMHHAVADGWSIALIVKEINACYNARISGRKHNVAPLAIQYSDFAAWQRHLLQGAHLDGLVSFWRTTLSGDLAYSQLALKNSPSSDNVDPADGGEVEAQIDLDVLHRLKDVCASNGATLFMALVSAATVAISRINASDEVVLGTPVAGRNHPDTEELVGCFINTLVLRLDASGSPTFAQLLRRIGKVCTDAFDHQDLPFQKLVEAVKPVRRSSDNPLFDILVNMATMPDQEQLELEGAQIEEMQVASPRARFGLTIYGVEKYDGLSVRLLWQTRKYAKGQIQAFLEQLCGILTQVAQAPESAISAYSLMTRRFSDEIPSLNEIVDEVQPTTLPDLIRGTAQRFGDRIAIREFDRDYSYLELVEKSAAVSEALQRLTSFSRGMSVVIWGKRGFDAAAAIIGTMAAGGVVLTLDRETPMARLTAIVREASAKHVIIAGAVANVDGLISASHWEHVLHMSSIMEGRGLSLKTRADPVDPAYIFFTSGTTGKPKGVLGQHRALAHFLTWQRKGFSLSEHDKAAQLTNMGFDVFLRDMFTPLISGATVCVPPDEGDVSAEALFPWFESQQITLLHSVPTVMKFWLRDPRIVRPLSSLRLVFSAGEALSASLVAGWREFVCPTVRVVNFYGPTETTLAKCYFEVPFGELNVSTVPVGKPMSCTQVHVLNGLANPCGPSEIGEVVIRTRYPSLGYLGSGWSGPNFERNPNSTDPNDVLYHTGDFGYWTHDGLLTLVGRRDDQVKVRGVRITLSEIQAGIESHLAVADCVVIPFRDNNADTCVRAYYVSKVGLKTTADEIRMHLSTCISAHAMPASIIEVDQLPINANGKLDRGRLPSPPTSESGGTLIELPSTDLERRIRDIWVDLLGTSDVGVATNFFDAGGHSLLLMKLKHALRDKLGIDLPVVDLFSSPTIQKMAILIDTLSDRLQGPGNGEAVQRAALRRDLSNRRRRLPATDLRS